MKSTKFRPLSLKTDHYIMFICSRTLEGTFAIWSHRKLRGYVWITHSYTEEASGIGWKVRALDGTIVGGKYSTRRLAAIRLLTDHRFSGTI